MKVPAVFQTEEARKAACDAIERHVADLRLQDSFGFTWEDVVLLRVAESALENEGIGPTGLLSLADRIEALLPPRKP